jgi:hypothetical protein
LTLDLFLGVGRHWIALFCIQLRPIALHCLVWHVESKNTELIEQEHEDNHCVTE